MDYRQDYDTYAGWDAGRAMILDTFGFVAGIAIAAAIGYFIAPVALGIGLTVFSGLLIGTALDVVKNKWLRKKQ